MPELESRVAGQYVPRSTDRLAVQAKNLIKDDINAAETLARTDTSDKAADVANTIARTLTEQGRALQAASILGRLTPEGVVRFAAREIQKYNEAIDVAKTKLGGINPTALRKKNPELKRAPG